MSDTVNTSPPVTTTTTTVPAEPTTTPAQTKTEKLLAGLLEDMGPIAEHEKTMKIGLFGEPGSGKSTIAAGALKDNNVFYCDADLTGVAIPKLANSKGYYRFRTVKRLELIADFFSKNAPELAQFDTIVVDPINEIHKSALAEIAKREYTAAGGPTPQRPTPYTIIGGYGGDHMEANERIRQLITKLRHTGRNLIIISHVRYTKEGGDEGPTTYSMDMSEKLTNTISGMMDLVAYTKQLIDVSGTVAVEMIIRSGAHKTKTRMRNMPNDMTNPTWNKLYTKYIEHIESGEK